LKSHTLFYGDYQSKRESRLISYFIQRVNLALIYKPLLAEQAEKNLHLSKGQGVKGLSEVTKVKDPLSNITLSQGSFMACFIW